MELVTTKADMVTATPTDMVTVTVMAMGTTMEKGRRNHK